MVRRFGDSIIEYLMGSQRFDIRLDSMVRWFDHRISGRFAKVRYSPRFASSLVRRFAHRISGRFAKVRYSPRFASSLVRRFADSIESANTCEPLHNYFNSQFKSP